VYETSSYKFALSQGGMREGEAHVVSRTICAIAASM